MKISPMVTELFHADGRTDTTKLGIAFRNFVTIPKNNGNTYSVYPKRWGKRVGTGLCLDLLHDVEERFCPRNIMIWCTFETQGDTQFPKNEWLQMLNTIGRKTENDIKVHSSLSLQSACTELSVHHAD